MGPEKHAQLRRGYPEETPDEIHDDAGDDAGIPTGDGQMNASSQVSRARVASIMSVKYG